MKIRRILYIFIEKLENKAARRNCVLPREEFVCWGKKQIRLCQQPTRILKTENDRSEKDTLGVEAAPVMFCFFRN